MAHQLVTQDPINELTPVAAELAADMFNELRAGNEETAALILDSFNGAGAGFGAFVALLKHVSEEERDESYFTLRKVVASRAKFEAEARGLE